MLIVPFARKMDWKKPPLVTLALVLVNVLIFSFWQAGDGQRYQAAFDQYRHSSLPKIEIPRYEAFLRQHHRSSDAARIARMRHDPRAYPGIVIAIQRDPAFQHALADGDIVHTSNPAYAQWHQDRQAFEAKFNDIVEENYAFKPAMPKLAAVFMHMFLHGSIMHLVGNMVFLLIVGLVVERLIGSGIYLAAYFVGGLVALAFFAAFNRDMTAPLLGASGAIAAIMGIYAALFGTRKIPFFYSLGFYFDTIRAPAYVLLIAWLATQGYEHLTDKASGVAYLAHFGGLLGGAAMGYTFLHLRMVDPADLETVDEQEQVQPWWKEYERGMALLGRLESAKAAEAFARLHQQYPQEPDILRQYYKSAKYQPESDAYHQSALAVLDGAASEVLPIEQVCQVFSEYLKLARPKPRLGREQLHRLAAYFLKHHRIDETMRLAKVLIRNDGGSERTAGLALGLARQLRLKEQLEDAGKLLHWVLHQHGESSLAVQARTMLQAIPEADRNS